MMEDSEWLGSGPHGSAMEFTQASRESVVLPLRLLALTLAVWGSGTVSRGLPLMR